jgi:phosphomannomutase
MATLILVVATTRDPHRQAEALRAALGLTLRGARVEVAVVPPLLTPLAQRAADTLRAFGHVVGELPIGPELAAALVRADRVEVWT